MVFFGLKIKGFVEVHPGLPEGCHKTWRRAKTPSSGAEKRRQAMPSPLPFACWALFTLIGTT